jgi:hypothetical protein
MTSKLLPSEFRFSIEEACTLSTQCWRLGRLADCSHDNNDRSQIRYAVRQMTEILEAKALRVIDFSGRAYDPGMAPEIVEVREDPDMPDGHSIIEETVSPTVTWEGQLIKPGQVILKRSPTAVKQNSEVAE